MIVVTGGAGFIGSNLVTALADRGLGDVLVVDRLDDDRKRPHVERPQVAAYLDRDEFLRMVTGGSADLADVTGVFHQGACSSTTHPDEDHVMSLNRDYSIALVRWCVDHAVPLVYASSAAVYGAGDAFAEVAANERPANVYARSKLLVDREVRAALDGASSQLVGLRYFNVYGPGEAHKDEMASLAAQLHAEVRSRGTATIFGASHGLGPGEQRRDFVSVDDVVDVVLWFAAHPEVSGIFNVGTGESRTFGELASIVADHGGGRVVHRPFPPELVDRYQPSTCADLTALRAAGYGGRFTSMPDGVRRYLEWLDR